MIYFVQAGDSGHIKIGYTNDIARRVSALQTGCPVALRVIGVIDPGDPLLELDLHKRFDAFRTLNEWFSPDELLLSYIRENAAPHVNRDAKEARTQAARVLAKFPTVRALSRETGIGESTISMWRSREWIPAPYHQTILDAAYRMGVDLSPDDFFERPHRPQREIAA